MTMTDDQRTMEPTATRPYVVISSDTHVGSTYYSDFTEYVDPAHREEYAAMADSRDNPTFAVAPTMPGEEGDDPNNPIVQRQKRFAEIFSQQMDEPDPVRKMFKQIMLASSVAPEHMEAWAPHYSSETIEGGSDSAKRLSLLEKQGVVGEISIPGGAVHGAVPALSESLCNFDPANREFTWAQMQAYNRWLRDFAAGAPGRRATPIMVDLHDLDAALAELVWAKEAGMFGGIILPQMSLESGLVGYGDAHWEPLWSLCEETGSVLNLHVGARANDLQLMGSTPEVVGAISGYETFYRSRRPVWFMMLSGVFDRHPGLKLSVIENRCEWVPDAIAEMGNVGFGGTRRSALELDPEEYFGRNIFLGASLMKRATAERRHEIGIDCIMWGSDYPHPEGSTPFMGKAIKWLFGGLPVDDVRKMVGGTAIEVYGFDEKLLQQTADRVGPTVEDLSEQLTRAEFPPTHASPAYN